jgi:tRNA (mo5U34)-methyltransferase
MGAGDGDLSVFFESLGLTVDAIDHAAINYNGMQGLHALKDALVSSADIQTFDPDTQFVLRRPIYGLMFLFGVLYHLRNPLYVLDIYRGWIERLIERAGWEIHDFMTTGDVTGSDPVHKEHDDRAFCLLRSRVTDFARPVELVDGCARRTGCGAGPGNRSRSL